MRMSRLVFALALLAIAPLSASVVPGSLVSGELCGQALPCREACKIGDECAPMGTACSYGCEPEIYGLCMSHEMIIPYEDYICVESQYGCEL